ncbi:uncharacterized protein K02A2.6-like [Wyeomyia smithii]|uniref:uncharacterized protein K02A2.6-like n=1 Tax=Wyeomyia smithii TaxID=174621 RepID=UPI002467AEA7|nr:uncharacterized protein K02A2.6-like [Wyeomyia smithii]
MAGFQYFSHIDPSDAYLQVQVDAASQPPLFLLLDKGHSGVERMRSVARQYVYWPNIDEEVAILVRSCDECASVAKTDRKTNLESWPAPTKPWQKLHLDFAGPMDGNFFLILVDSYTKWPEVVRTEKITTPETLRILRGMFARYGNPETLVTDNGTQLTSSGFEAFGNARSIIHLKTALYHPQSNGLAERSTPCRSAPGGKSPGDLMFGRPIRTALELLRPPTTFQKQLGCAQEQQFNRKHGTKARSYHPQDLVWAKVYSANKWIWQYGMIIECIGSVMYNVWLPSKQSLIRSQCNQLRNRLTSLGTLNRALFETDRNFFV